MENKITFNELNESFVGVFLAYRLIKLLATPFTKWTAFKLKLIDAKGNVLKKPVTTSEKNAYGMFERIVRKLKVLMALAIGNSKTASILSTLYLLKENNDDVEFYNLIKENGLEFGIINLLNTLKENMNTESYDLVEEYVCDINGNIKEKMLLEKKVKVSFKDMVL